VPGFLTISCPKHRMTAANQAFAARIIKDGQAWIDMLEQRNLMSHTYDSQIFQNVFTSISQHYLIALEQVFRWLKEKSRE